MKTVTIWIVSCQRYPPIPRSQQATRHGTRVADGHSSGDELISKDNFHFPTPDTALAFRNLPAAPKGHLPLRNGYAGNRRTEINSLSQFCLKS